MTAEEIIQKVSKEMTLPVSELIKEINVFKDVLLNGGTEFSLGNEIDQILQGLQNLKGLYLFQIKLPSGFQRVEFFKNFWDKTREAEGANNYPRVNGQRIQQGFSNNVDEWIPLYLGKSKELPARIKQHITLEKTSATYALKLKSQEGLFTDWHFKFSTISFNALDERFYFLCEILEEELRKVVCPIVGAQ